jgi:hypothetical protein
MPFIRAGRTLPTAILLLCLAAAVFAQVPSSKHVVLVIDENSSYSSVKANMPWLISHGNAYGYATKYQSDNGGSLLDYLWLASGSCHSGANCSLPSGTHDFNCNGNSCFYPGTSTTDAITDNNIFRVLNNAGISWKVYAQSYAAAGGTVTTPDNHNGTAYYRRHNGATWYSDVIKNVNGSAGKVVDLSRLSTDLQNGTLPRFTIIVPDGHHDAHDCPVGMSSCSEAQKLAAADQFLSSNLGPVLNLPDFKAGGSGLAIVTFDECGGGTNSGCGASVYTALIGPRVKPHTVSYIPYKHENALRTILDSLGVKSYPGASANAAGMADFFTTTTATKPQVVINSPAPGTSQASPVQIDATASPSPGHSVTGWWIYVDSVGVYNGGAVSYISPLVKMSPGTHTVVVRAWDTSGAYGDGTFKLTTSTASPTVSIATPSNNTSSGSPLNLQAAASATPGQSIRSWLVQVDGKNALTAGATSKISLHVPLAQGKHNVIVRAYDTSNAYGSKTFTVTATANPAITVSKPMIASNVISPIRLGAFASALSGGSIVGWWVYVDGVGKYHAGAVNSIAPSIAASMGAHTILIRAWDSTGAYGSQAFKVNVRPVAVNISNPLNAAQVASSINVSATATSPKPIAAWTVYVDSGIVHRKNYGNTLNANLQLTPGTHKVTVRSWDSTGAFGDQAINVTVP